jgi:hypothetical protein
MGPMTGRAAGYCAGYIAPGFNNPGPAIGCRGGGRGWRNRYYTTGLTGWQRAPGGWSAWGNAFAPMQPYGPPVQAEEKEINTLKEQANYLKNTLESIFKRIEELETKK